MICKIFKNLITVETMLVIKDLIRKTSKTKKIKPEKINIH